MGSFLHAGQQLFPRPAAAPAATCNFWTAYSSCWTATCSSSCTWTAAPAAPSSTPDSSCTWTAAPAAHLHARQLLHLDSSTCSTPPRQTAPALGQHSCNMLPRLLQHFHASCSTSTPPSTNWTAWASHGHHMDSICSTFPYLAAKHT
jgi:hypothetical protein